VAPLVSWNSIRPLEARRPASIDQPIRALRGGRLENERPAALAALQEVYCRFLREVLLPHLVTACAAGSNIQGVQGAYLNPLGLFLNLRGLFLRTSIPFIWRVLSAFLRA
jgi:hypothetical protein